MIGLSLSPDFGLTTSQSDACHAGDKGFSCEGAALSGVDTKGGMTLATIRFLTSHDWVTSPGIMIQYGF
jgi:hypothetical protein